MGQNKTLFDGELGIGFKMFEEKYTSKVTCEHPKFVEVYIYIFVLPIYKTH